MRLASGVSKWSCVAISGAALGAFAVAAVGSGRQRSAAYSIGALERPPLRRAESIKSQPGGHGDDQPDLERFAVHGFRELDRVDLLLRQFNPHGRIHRCRR